MFEKITSIVFMFILFYLTLRSITNFNGIDLERITELIDEYDKGFIDDIQIKEITDKCDTNYFEMIIYQYPGNYNGCLCRDKNKSFYNSNHTCPLDLDCIKIEDLKAKLMSVWKTKLICYRTSSLILKDATLIDPSINGCGDTKKVCGLADSLGYVLCVNNSISCPISNIQFLNKGSNNYYSLLTEKKGHMLNLTESSFLYYEKQDKLSKDLKSLPLIYSKFSTGISMPCSFSKRLPKAEILFPFEKNFSNYGCTFKDGFVYDDISNVLDLSYTLKDSYQINTFFEENGLKSIMSKLIILSYLNETVQINLYARRFTGWKKSCQNYGNGLVSFLNIEYQLSNLLMSIILHCIILVLLQILLALSSCFLYTKFELLFRVVNLIYLIVNMVYPVQVISSTNKIINTVVDDSGEYCSDNTVNIILKSISDACLNLHYSYVKILLLNIVFCFLIIYGLYRWYKPYHEQYQETYKKYIERK